MRIIFVPQFPSEMRYQEWWFTEFPNQFRERGFDVVTLGEDYSEMIKHRRSTLDMFSPIDMAIELEAEQIKEYINLELKEDDVLFWADISFPGLFGHVLFHKRPKKMFAFCHATSINAFDYYAPLREFKYPIEKSICAIFDKIFVGSNYHKNKLGWNNIQVTYLPFQPELHTFKNVNKTIDIMSASRPSVQKVDPFFEDYVEEQLMVKIQRPVSNSWKEYHWNLHQAKVLLISAKEDTFGYQIVDAIRCGCIPIAKNSFSYPELLPEAYLYDDRVRLIQKLDTILNIEPENSIQVPKLLCEEQMNNFYATICDEMRKE